MQLPVAFAVCGVVAVASVPVSAQQASGSSAGPGLGQAIPRPQTPPQYETVVQASPEWSQDRNFAGTRFWKLDQGRFAVEQWWRLRVPRDGEAYHILQTEVEIGLTPRVQLDIYENLTNERGDWTHEGNQIEARIA